MSSTSTAAIQNPYKLYFLARVELQLHSLNAAGSIGNYTKLQEGDVIHGDDVAPVPVITGNALKNWHARKMTIHYTDLGGEKIHERHFRDMLRLAPEDVEKKQNVLDIERGIVASCAICDVHGFLVPIAPPIRRQGLIRFSFAVPVEEIVAQRLKFGITHNRVVPVVEGRQKVEEKEGEREEEEREVEMMIIKREYASAIYAFDSVLDIAMIGRSQYQKETGSQKEGMSKSIGRWLGSKLIDGQSDKEIVEEIALRAKAAILAFDAVLTGEIGANVSRALPLAKPVAVVAIVTNRSIPKPLHPYYRDWQQDLANILRVFNDRIERVYVYGIKKAELIQSSLSKTEGKVNEKKDLEKKLEEKIAEDFSTWYELIKHLAEDVGNALRPPASRS